jgi:protein TonB
MRGKVTIPAPDAPPPAAPQTAAKPAPPSGGRLQQAQLVTRVLPAYPDLARRSAIYGTIQLDAVVDETGTVKDVKVVSGVPVLALAAKDAVLKWKYKPALLNGKPVATNVKIQISFGAHQ